MYNKLNVEVTLRSVTQKNEKDLRRLDDAAVS